MRYQLTCLTCVLLLLSGCGSRTSVVNQEMESIKNQPPLPVEKAPIFETTPSFQYGAQNLRSPFLPSSLYTELKVMAGKRVYPNFSRAQQPLEVYPLESLAMKGTLRGANGNDIALIQAPDSQIYRVQVGNYMGLNQGRIVKISPTKIDLLEVISDGNGGYVERPRALVLLGQTS
ncbi:pilus assembly protein PilP [Acinetobacter sp. ESL0695]|uniref:pilus assembly protein PilP n=1 Tax=Acinetobacter sp. ESL0695 TaxID=2983215 RepID=UPI0023F3441E|nr:pilus assembly protein PilP [Acinetobacter sp. ESL0695]WEV49173.1 pilus assembly protein PilP [Acinetobacter sp. ESL0695]